MNVVIERELELRLVLSPDRSVAVPARFSYHTNDPYAVHVSFHTGSQNPVNWTFSRELLVEGVFRPCGHGDVRVWPTKVRGRSVICLALTAPDGEALIEASAAPVASWLERTLRAVAPGSEPEQLEWDAELRTVLASSVRADRPQGDHLYLCDPWLLDEPGEPGA